VKPTHKEVNDARDLVERYLRWRKRGLTPNDAAHAAGYTLEAVRVAIAWLADAQEEEAVGADWNAEYLPTEEQIAAACLEIQAGWDDLTRELRLVTKSRPVKYDIPRLV
jgi:hypothetical protein